MFPFTSLTKLLGRKGSHWLQESNTWWTERRITSSYHKYDRFFTTKPSPGESHHGVRWRVVNRITGYDDALWIASRDTMTRCVLISKVAHWEAVISWQHHVSSPTLLATLQVGCHRLPVRQAFASEDVHTRTDAAATATSYERASTSQASLSVCSHRQNRRSYSHCRKYETGTNGS